MQFFTIFGAEESAAGIGALGINGQALLIQLITFVLAYIVLRRYAFAPILKILRERRETIESGVALGEAMQKERANLDAKLKAEMQAARRQADAVLADANNAARDTVKAAEDTAKVKADGIVAEAQVRGEQAAQRLRVELEQEMVGLVANATEAIIDEKLDTQKDAALIDRALKGARA